MRRVCEEDKYSGLSETKQENTNKVIRRCFEGRVRGREASEGKETMELKGGRKVRGKEEGRGEGGEPGNEEAVRY